MKSGDHPRIAASFNERAKGYGNNNWHRFYAERLVTLTALKRGDHVLDAGMGTGFATLPIARRVGTDGHVLGIDISPGMLEQARISISTAGIQNIELLEADATDLGQYQTSTFDAVICAASLLYMPIPQALAEWYRVLKPEGILAFSTMRMGSPKAGQLFRQCAGTFGITLKDPSEELGSEERCLLFLENSGFKHIRVIAEQVELSSLDLAQAWESNFRSAAHSTIWQLNASDQEELRRRYERLLIQAQNNDPAAIHRADVLYAFGQR